MMNMERVGSAFCHKCKMRVELSDLDTILISYPRGANKNPTATVRCSECQTLITAPCDWKDAVRFDFAGAKVEGFSFARGDILKEEEIDEFIKNIDSEISQFLKDSE